MIVRRRKGKNLAAASVGGAALLTMGVAELSAFG